MKKNFIPFNPSLDKWMKDPAFKQAYEEQELEYNLIRVILDARMNQGITQTELAQKMNTKQAVISRLESGNANPSLNFLKRLAIALNATLEIKFKFQ